MSFMGSRDINSEITIRRAAANTAVTAGGAGDNTAVTGVIIDRAALGWAESLAVAILFATTLSASQTLSINWTVQHGEDAGLSDAATLATSGPVVVATGVGTVAGQVEAGVSLRGARRYVRLNFTPDLSAGSTDTAALSAALVFGGANRLPA